MDRQVSERASTHLKVLNQFLGQADAKDKLTAAIQYALMFASAGEPGNLRKAMASVTAARKVFRVLRPLEAISPLLLNPRFGSKPIAIEILLKLRPILNAMYFGADHVVWASQAGILTNKALVDKFQKTSLYSWFGASLCTGLTELYELAQAAKKRPDEDEASWRERVRRSKAEIDRRAFVLTHAVVQALLAAGLLQLRPWKPRFVGLLGLVASLMNCYLLYPAAPRPVKATAPAEVALPALGSQKLPAKTA